MDTKDMNLFSFENKGKKSLMDIKRELQSISENEMTKILGGKITKERDKWNNGCSGIVPQQ